MRADVVTISREYGAGASQLAALLGTALEWPVLDTEIPLEVARRLHIPEESLEEWDEHAPRLLESLGSALLLGSPDLLVDPTYTRRPAPRDIAEATREFLLERVQEPPVIIVGHGAQALFQDRPRTVHLRLVAPIEERARRVMVRRACSHEDAIAIANLVDRDRVHYVQQYLHRDARDPRLYALLINTGFVAMPDAVRIVRALVEDPPA